MSNDRSMSPTATGGAGEQFEQHVAAFALGLLLVRATPPVLIDTSVVEVHLQAGHLGWQTDDLLLVGEGSNGVRRKLALQVKRSFSVSAANEDCRKTIFGMWKDYLAADRFDQAADQLAVVTLHGTSALLRDFGALLHCARASADAEDFGRRASLEGYLSVKAQSQNRDVRQIVAEAGSTPADDVYWRFLRTVNILSFDFGSPTAQAEASVLGLLAHCAGDGGGSLDVARDGWAALLRLAGDGKTTARSYVGQDSLPSDLQARYVPVSSADRAGLGALVEHGMTVRDGIRSTIGDGYAIDRGALVQELASQLVDHEIVIVSGAAGSGKSAVARALLTDYEGTYPVLAFQAVEFATAHVDQVLANAQTTLNLQRMMALLATHDAKVILVDGLERLLERSVRDGFTQLLQLAQRDRSTRIVLTVRDYSLETVRNALMPSDVAPAIFEMPLLSDAELNRVREGVPSLVRPLADARLRGFLRTPYLLDLASRLGWAESSFPASLREFRRKVWQDLIRAEGYPGAGMPERRGRVFLDIAWRRAVALRSFVPGNDDAEAMEALKRDSLLHASGDSAAVYAVTHDVLEDWGVLQAIDDRYVRAEGSVAVVAQAIGGFPAVRRGFRQWLAERFDVDPDDAGDLVLRAVGDREVPRHFRDDCFVAALLSESAEVFVDGCRGRILSGDLDLLIQLVHILRVACKVSPKWLNVPGLPSLLLVPTGSGWAPTLRLVLDAIDGLLRERPELVIGLVEDWARQVRGRDPKPDGAAEAGLIADRLLGEFDDYGSADARKRVLKIVVKVPCAVPRFRELIERAKTSDRADRVAYDLMELVCTNPEGALACLEFPDEVIGLLDARFRLTAENRERERRAMGSSLGEVDYGFGIRRAPVGSFFPPSALQGPFRVLLEEHPAKAVAFTVSLLNHSADWYAKERGPGRVLEPAAKTRLEIPGHGTVSQWADRLLYSQYRGNQVGPDLVQSMLMALESWLLALAKTEGADVEPWLLSLLRDSNNVMTTSVVASVCIAHPEKAGRAALALLSSREVVQLDRQRLALESGAARLFSGLNPESRLYEQERTTADELPHRKEDLEMLAVRLQFTEHRDEIWSIIDQHRDKLSAGSGEDTRVWRLALHRMDARDFEPKHISATVEGDGREGTSHRVVLVPAKLEADVQEMVEQTERSAAPLGRYLGLQNRARKAWDRDGSVEPLDWKESLLGEAQAIERELEEAEEFYRDGQGLASAVCIRDHLAELSQSDFEWCVSRVDFEVRRKSTGIGYLDREQRTAGADCVCASVVPLLTAHGRQVAGIDMTDLLALALTHPVHEVTEYAFGGLGAFVGDNHKALALECVAAAAYRSRLEVESWEDVRQRQVRVDDWRRFESVVQPVRAAFEKSSLDVDRELASVDFGEPLAGPAIRAALRLFEQRPAWDESWSFYSRVADWLANTWRTDGHAGESVPRDYELEHAAGTSLGRFLFRLPLEDALRIGAPVLDAAVDHRRDGEWFLTGLILAADSNADGCFWGLWQQLADGIVQSEWARGLTDKDSFGHGLLNMIFLGSNWKEEAEDWHRLDGHVHRVEQLVRDLPSTVPVLRAYTSFLSRIGQVSMPRAFEVVADVLEEGNAVRLASTSDVAFDLERLLRPFVYSEPHRLKTDPGLRNAVMVILDALVEGGSPSAYRMRDDFVTPSSR